MSDLIKDATNVLADLLGGKRAEPDGNPLWSQLTPLDDMSQGSPLIEGIQGESMAPLSPSRGSPYDVSVDKINEIVRSGKKGFQTFDINPFTLTYDNFKCRINSQVLWELIEYEPEVENYGGDDSLIKLSWRTVPIEVSGTWMKVEFLPSRKNYSNTINDITQSGVADSKTLNYNPSQISSSTTDNPADQPMDNALQDRNSSRQILIQFEGSDSPVLIAKHGETFKLPFNKVFVSMRQTSPRIRIVIGYNSEIINNENERASNMSLSMSPGIGLWNSPTMYPVPFSMNWKGIPFLSSGSANFLDSTASGIKIYTVIDQSATVTYPVPPVGPFHRVLNGIAILWVTSFNYTFLNTSFANRTFLTEIYAGGVTVGNDYTQGKTVYTKVGVSGPATDSINVEVSFSTPVRIVLKPLDSLKIRMVMGTGGTPGSAEWAWSMTGYTLGKLHRVDFPKATDAFPFYLNTLSENPFPDDYSRDLVYTQSEP